jgi:uncharacterized membrane protein
MNTLFDFITHVKVVEYLISIAAIAGFLLMWEILKPKPFKTIVETSKDDLGHIKQSGGIRAVMKTAGKIVAAPFIGLAYIVMLPVGFFTVLSVSAFNLAMNGIMGAVGSTMTFDWNPIEAYLTGRKKKEKALKEKGK